MDEHDTGTGGSGGFDLDDLARRASGVVTGICRRATGVAVRVLLLCGLISITSFALGLAVFDEGMRTVWIVLGGGFLLLAVGGPALAAWRVGSVRRHADELIAELRTLVERGDDERRVVIETVDLDDAGFDAPPRVRSTSTMISTNQLFSMRQMVGGATDQFRRITMATSALTSFPVLVLVAVLVSVVFAGLGLIFLIALAL